MVVERKIFFIKPTFILKFYFFLNLLISQLIHNQYTISEIVIKIGEYRQQNRNIWSSIREIIVNSTGEFGQQNSKLCCFVLISIIEACDFYFLWYFP